MKKNERGFTLLEMCISFILFAIMLESIWGFFSNIYRNYIQLNQQVSLVSEATNVEEFIKQEIRAADRVLITTTTGEHIEVIYKESPNNIDVKNKALKKIQYMVKVPKTSGIGYEKKECELVLSPISSVDGTKGNYRLSYSVKSIGGIPVVTNNTVVSEMVESIKITSYKNSDLVEFTCEFQKKDEENNRIQLTKKFIESLEYKQHY